MLFYDISNLLNSVVIGLSVTALVVLVFLIILIAFLCIGRCQRQTEENQQTQGVCSALQPTFGVNFCNLSNSYQVILMKGST